MQKFQFVNGNGERFEATLEIVDAKKAAECMANRVLRKGKPRRGEMRSAKALDGGIILKLERIND